MRIFAGTSDWDDEGYIMISLQGVLAGQPLYDQIYSQYGPGYYLSRWIFHSLTAQPVTHDLTRLISCATALLVSFVLAGVVYSLTRSWLSSCAALLVAGVNLRFFGYEPGHPQELCIFLVSLIIAAAAAMVSERWRSWALRAAAVATGFLLATKINAGVFAAVALALVGILFGPRGRWQTFAGTALSFVGLILPAVLLRADLSTAWAAIYCFCATCGFLAALLAAYTRTQPMLPPRSQFLCGAFLAGGLILPLIWALAKGTTVYSLLHGILLQHFEHGGRHWLLPAPLGPVEALFAALLLILAIWWSARRHESGEQSECFLAMLKVALPLLVVADMIVFRRLPMFQLLPWTVWLVVTSGPEEQRISRTCLALVVSLQSLYAYPVAGSQLSYVGTLAATVAIIFFDDGVRQLWCRVQHAKWELLWPRSLAVYAFVPVLALGYAGWLLKSSPYLNMVSLNLHGAKLVREFASKANVLQAATKRVSVSCSALYSMPGMFSFNFWSGVPSPTSLNLGHWMALFDEQTQRQVVHALEGQQKACVLVNHQIVRFWTRQDVSQMPLPVYIASQFILAESFGSYELWVRKSG
jgi:hypothetical protein